MTELPEDGADTAELTDDDLAHVATDEDPTPDPYTPGFDGVQDPDADPAEVVKAEARTEVADDA